MGDKLQSTLVFMDSATGQLLRTIGVIEAVVESTQAEICLDSKSFNSAEVSFKLNNIPLALLKYALGTGHYKYIKRCRNRNLLYKKKKRKRHH